MSSAQERSKRSILVGNIPGDTTEEQLRLLLREFGSIVNFRFFNDSSGNQIGYAFCEYENQDMAVRAIHKLNDFQFRGQLLKVDTAASDKSKEELESFLQGGGSNERMMTEQSDQDSSTEKAPEEISKAVASLPPEQMFELMKQMKMCIENNPHEARNLLLQNPQLAYALLQAQVIMHIVDPEVAIKILDRSINVTPAMSNVPTSDANTNPESAVPVSGAENNPPLFPGGFPLGNDQDMRTQFKDSDMRSLNNTEIGKHLFDPRYRSGIDPRMMQPPNIGMQDPRVMSGPDSRGMPVFDPRTMLGPDPRRMPVPDPRGMPVPDPRGMPVHDPRGMPNPDSRGMPILDPRGMSISGPREMPILDSRGMPIPGPRGMPTPDPRGMPTPDPRGMPTPDPRGMPTSDPRGMPTPDPRGMQIPDPRGMQILDPRGMPITDPRGIPTSDPRSLQNLDSRLDTRSATSLDPRAMRAQDPRMSQLPDPRMMPMSGPDPRLLPGLNKMNLDGRIGPNVDPRAGPVTDPRLMPGSDPRALGGGDPRMHPGDLRVGPVTDPRARSAIDPRLKPNSVEDPRKPSTSDSASAPASHLLAGARALVPPTSSAPSSIGVPPSHSSDVLSSMSLGSMQQDQEKAALIMQVLQLSDDQIAMLPPEQRQSILMLKEQIARSHLT